MKNTRLIIFFSILFFVLIYPAAFVFGNTIFYDFDGNAVDKSTYEQTVSDRDKNLSMKLRNGYGVQSNGWKDPIKLRKTRIEQWRLMRSRYNPDSLPIKIENPSTKNK